MWKMESLLEFRVLPSLARRVVFLSALLLGAAPAVSGEKFLQKQTPECTCQICESAKRTESYECGAQSMCEPEPFSLSESLLCMVPSDSALMPGEQGLGVPKQKFCLNSCVPQQDPNTLKLQMDAMCTDINEEQMELIPEDPNGVDPACVIAHLESLAIVIEGAVADSSSSAASAAAAGADGGEDGAEKMAPPPRATEKDVLHLHANTVKTQATLLNVRAARAATRAEEAAISSEESLEAAEQAATENETALADIKSILAQTKLYKQAAWKAREETKALLGEINSAASTAAQHAAQKAKAAAEEDLGKAQKLRDENVGRFTPVVEPIAVVTAAAARATAPYDVASAKAAAVQSAFAGSAQKLNRKAHAVQRNAKSTLKQSVDLQGGGLKDLAAQYHQRAVDLFKKAADLQDRANSQQAQADEIGAQLPAYAALSAHAALHADDRAAPEIPPPATLMA
ncbi:unnamed protein product [Amoebophrya sp. A25]|nr:unnamed protein product [Amoebophrya sp. A25]|eukprot:GSA25T00008400001.1